jgi:hypothetical protein
VRTRTLTCFNTWSLICDPENLAFYTSNSHLRHILVACSPIDLPLPLFNTLPLDKVTLIETLPLPPALTALPIKVTKLSTIFNAPPPIKSPKPRDRDRDRDGRDSRDRSRNGPQLQLMQQEDDGGGATWLVIQPDGHTSHHSRSKSQGPRRALGRNRGSDDDTESLSISIGPNNTVQVDSGRRRRLM